MPSANAVRWGTIEEGGDPVSGSVFALTGLSTSNLVGGLDVLDGGIFIVKHVADLSQIEWARIMPGSSGDQFTLEREITLAGGDTWEIWPDLLVSADVASLNASMNTLVSKIQALTIMFQDVIDKSVSLTPEQKAELVAFFSSNSGKSVADLTTPKNMTVEIS